MARLKKRATTASVAEKPQFQRPSNAERSSYFARREAAKVLRFVLQGDANGRAIGSIKSLVYSPSVRNKKATFALVCQTLKYLPIIKEVLNVASILNSKWKRQGELMYIITYDILFGQAASLVGDAEKFVMLRKDALQSALAQILVRKGVKNVKDMMALQQISDISKPRYVRVNTLKLDMESALSELGKQCLVHKDDLVPNLLVLPSAVDLHNHPLVINGSLFLQGKASSMAAIALQPEPGWEVLDAFAAPGNKTVHLAALMGGNGKIVACELNKKRIQRLKDTVKLAAADNVEVLHEDFLNLNPKDPSYSKVRAILLDPSCSGSGTAAIRLDHLLPSHGAGNADASDDRLRKLQAFQKKALAHALSFPAVERVVYSTCSIHQIENEDVIKSILPLALSLGFQLETPFPQWVRRGLPVLEGSGHLLRTDPAEDKEGFFISLFIRKSILNHGEMPITTPCRSRSIFVSSESKALCAEKSSSSSEKKPRNNNKYGMISSYCLSIKLSKMWLHQLRMQKRKRAAPRKRCTQQSNSDNVINTLPNDEENDRNETIQSEEQAEQIKEETTSNPALEGSDGRSLPLQTVDTPI